MRDPTYKEALSSLADLLAQNTQLRAELEAAKRDNAQLAAAFTIGQDEFRYCQFCGCLSNARLRRCCDKGTKTDLSKSTALRDLLAPTMELLMLHAHAEPPLCNCKYCKELARLREVCGEKGTQ